MDVYGGGTGARAVQLREQLGGQLDRLGLDLRELDGSSRWVTRWGDGTGETLHVEDDDVEVVFDGYLHHHGRASLREFLPDLAHRVIGGGRVLAGTESGIFNVVVRDKRTGTVHLANDPSGLLPLFHGRSDDGFWFTSHLYLAARTLDLEPDLMGVACMVTLGYTIGSRTYFAGVERLNPGELVTYRPDTAHITRRYPETYFATYREPDGDPTDAIWDALVSAARPDVDAGRSVGIMLSEGFDSRLIAGVYAHLGADLHTFTHATPGTAGTEIVRQVADRLGSTHTFDHLEAGFPSDLPDLRRQLALADNLHVPFWAPGAHHFRTTGVDVTTTGYALDTTLGAHALTTSRGSTTTRVLQRYREIALQDLGRTQDHHIETLAQHLLDQARAFDVETATARVHRFLSTDLADTIVSHLHHITDEITTEQQRIRDTSDGLASQVLQRYFLENRVRKYSYGQELTLRTENRVATPSYEPAFMRLMSSVPPRHRLNHRTYLRLLRRHLPELARIDSGAHALPPTYPRLALETSRFARKAHENRLITAYLASHGTNDLHQLRTVLFPDATGRQTPRFALEDLLERDHTPLNRETMASILTRMRGYQMRLFHHSLYVGLELTEIFDEL